MTEGLRNDYARSSTGSQDLFVALNAAKSGLPAVAALQSYIEKGGHFSRDAKDDHGRNQLMAILRKAGYEGLRIFVQEGGTFNPAARDLDGDTEAMYVAHYAQFRGLQLFREKGGVFNLLARNKAGATEAGFIAFTGPEGQDMCRELLANRQDALAGAQFEF